MATVKWRGGVVAVAQVSAGSIDTFDAASTYTVTIGGYAISVAGDTNTATTAANLVSALNGSTHPYFAAVTWAVPSGSTVRGTGDVAGAPFLAALTVTGGTGTVTDFADTTACTGPHHASAAANWSGGALPASADLVIVDSGPSILYGLDAFSATALARVSVRQGFTSKIGLEASQFATSLDGETTDSEVPEYRDSYLEITADEVVVGEHIGPGSPSGSPRVCLDQKKAGASVLDVLNTSTTAVNSRPAVRYKAAHASADVLVKFAPGGVGVAVEPGDTSTVGDVWVGDDSTASALYLGEGVTVTTVEVHGGQSRLAAAATVTSVTCNGGELEITGYDYLITTLNVHGGTVTDTHENTGGAEWTTINLYGGKLLLPLASADTARAYTTLNLYAGRVEADWSGISGTEAVPDVATSPPRRAVEVSIL